MEKALSNSVGSEVHFEKIFKPIKPGDVSATYASTNRLQQAVGFKSETPIDEGLLIGLWSFIRRNETSLQLC